MNLSPAGRLGRMVSAAIAMVTVGVLPACGTSQNVVVGYQPPVLPLRFDLTFTRHPDGHISVSPSVGLVSSVETPIGVFSVDANAEKNLVPGQDETILVIRHRMGNGIVDSLYRIATSEQIIVILNGHSVVYVTNHKILIDASRAGPWSMEVKNAPVPRPPARGRKAALGTLRLVSVIRSPGMYISGLSWSRDGGLIADAGQAGDQLQSFVSDVWRVGNGAVVSSHHSLDYDVGNVSFSPAGSLVATTNRAVQIWSATTGATITVINYWAYAGVSWSPAGDYIVTSGQGAPVVWNALSGAQVSSYGGYDAFQAPAVWSPQGDFILSDATIWDGLTGRKVCQYLGGSQQAFFLASSWSPDSHKIASAENGGPLVLWDAATGATIWTQADQLDPSAPASVSWSPDGKYIVWASDTSVNIVNSGDGSPVASIGSSFFTDNVTVAAWDPSGQYIATVSGGTIQIWQAPRPPNAT